MIPIEKAPVCKQGLFCLQRSLLQTTKKPCFESKQGFFSNRQNNHLIFSTRPTEKQEVQKQYPQSHEKSERHCHAKRNLFSEEHDYVGDFQ